MDAAPVAAKTMIDVLCYGALLPDRVLRLPRFPHPGEGLHALDEHVYLGGEPCNVSGHLDRWGIQVGIVGNNLGDDAGGAFVERELARRTNTTLLSRRDPQIWTPQCYIWVTPDGERTIIPSWPPAPTFSLPPADVFAQARIVSVSIFGPGMDAMIDLAQAHGKPLAMADPPSGDDQRLRGAAIITTSQAMLHRRYGIHDVQGWIEQVWRATGALVVVSDSAAPVLVRTPDGRDLAVSPPALQPVDTTGAGDALKAALIFGWLHGWPVEDTLRLAIKAAAAVCMQRGPCPDVSTTNDQ